MRLFDASPVPLGTALLACAAALLVGACQSTDFLDQARDSLNRAFRYEGTAALLAPTLARARREPPPRFDPRAKQYHLIAIANLERLSDTGRESLRRQGLLGEAFVHKAIAQTRLDRLADARVSVVIATASRQEPPLPRDGALFRVVLAVLAWDEAVTAAAKGATPEALRQQVAQPGGVWARVTEARGSLETGEALHRDLLQLRLAAYLTVHDARAARRASEAGPDAAEAEAWARFAAQAQADLNDLAAWPAPDPTAHVALVRRWQFLCGLETPAR